MSATDLANDDDADDGDNDDDGDDDYVGHMKGLKITG